MEKTPEEIAKAIAENNDLVRFDGESCRVDPRELAEVIASAIREAEERGAKKERERLNATLIDACKNSGVRVFEF